MIFFIGITQHPEQLQSTVTDKTGDLNTLMEVGPFATRKEADGWKHSIEDRLESTNELFLTEEENEDDLWYGFTFEA